MSEISCLVSEPVSFGESKLQKYNIHLQKKIRGMIMLQTIGTHQSNSPPYKQTAYGVWTKF